MRLAHVDWIATLIDCVSATTCWLTGLNGRFGNLVEPILLKTSNRGATRQDHSNLPGSHSTNPAIAYALQDISCVSAASCVAVGGPNQAGGKGTVVATSNGGRTWTRFASAKLDNFQSVSAYNAQSGGNGGPQALDGTANGGKSWSIVTASPGNFDEGSVACLTVNLCVATTDDGLWLTTDDGGLAG